MRLNTRQNLCHPVHKPLHPKSTMWMPITLAAMSTVAVSLAVGQRAWKLRQNKTPTLQKAIEISMKTGDIDPIGEAVSALPAGQQINGINTAITRLWEGWERETAIRMIHEVAEHIPDELILQTWLRKAMEVEPELAQHYFSEAFLLAYFKPDVARTCGTGGCCG